MLNHCIFLNKSLSALPGIYVDIPGCQGVAQLGGLLLFFYPLSSGIASCVGTVMPTLDTALLCFSWAGADWGHESGLV